MKRILVTGSAGFIGFHLVKALLDNGYDVIGLDNLNDYYDVKLKESRLEEIEEFISKKNIEHEYQFIKLDLYNQKTLKNLFEENEFDVVVNLAAQAGVRYSLVNPNAYIESNLVGFSNILECCRYNKIKHLIFASSSSVYGLNTKQPFSTLDKTDYPISLYAATKKSNELLAYSYSHLYEIPTTGLRFFTVYGPNGRPDMAYFKFVESILNNKSISLFNEGNMERDFTYIDDVTSSLIQLIDRAPKPQIIESTNSHAPFRLFNIGNNNPISLSKFIEAIEKALGKKAKKDLLPMQPGDVESTFAEIDELYDEIGFKPTTSIEKGIEKFVEWYLENQIKN